ncbi:MAG: hypothetical protein K1W18_07255 [Oscillospiraceae bacterium]
MITRIYEKIEVPHNIIGKVWEYIELGFEKEKGAIILGQHGKAVLTKGRSVVILEY